MLITKGSTYRDVLRWADSLCRFVPIEHIEQSAPCRITAPGHGIPDGWEVIVESVQGMMGINDHQEAVKVIDENTIELPCLNAIDFRPYKGSGVLRVQNPVDLTGYKARMQIREYVGGPLLLELTSENGDIEIDPAAYTITRVIPASVTEEIGWRRGVYDMEMVLGDYVTKIDAGDATVQDEVTV